MFQLKTVLASLALALAAPTAADAALVTVRDNPNNGSSVFATGLGRNVAIRHDGADRTVRAGVFSLQYGEPSNWTNFLTFCLELSERLTLPKLHEEIAGRDYFANADDRQALGVLYGNFLTPEYGFKNASHAAGLQTIVWEIIEDGATNFDLSGGSFRVLTADVLNAANYLWSLIASGDFDAARLKVFAAEGTQDLIVNEVPLPAGAVLFATGLLAVAARRREKK